MNWRLCGVLQQHVVPSNTMPSLLVATLLLVLPVLQVTPTERMAMLSLVS
jgi:hypothetical protein